MSKGKNIEFPHLNISLQEYYLALQSNSRMTRHKVLPGTTGPEIPASFFDELANQNSNNAKEKTEIGKKKKGSASQIQTFSELKNQDDKKKEEPMLDEKQSSECEIKATKEDLLKAEEKKAKKKMKIPHIKKSLSTKSENLTPRKPKRGRPLEEELSINNSVKKEPDLNETFEIPFREGSNIIAEKQEMVIGEVQEPKHEESLSSIDVNPNVLSQKILKNEKSEKSFEEGSPKLSDQKILPSLKLKSMLSERKSTSEKRENKLKDEKTKKKKRLIKESEKISKVNLEKTKPLLDELPSISSFEIPVVKKVKVEEPSTKEKQQMGPHLKSIFKEYKDPIFNNFCIPECADYLNGAHNRVFSKDYHNFSMRQLRGHQIKVLLKKRDEEHIIKNAFILKHHKFRDDFFYVDYVKKDLEFKSQRQISRNENEVFIIQEPVLIELNSDDFKKILKPKISKTVDFADIICDDSNCISSGSSSSSKQNEKSKKGYWPVAVLQSLSQESHHDGLMNIFSKPNLTDDFDQFLINNTNTPTIKTALKISKEGSPNREEIRKLILTHHSVRVGQEAQDVSQGDLISPERGVKMEEEVPVVHSCSKERSSRKGNGEGFDDVFNDEDDDCDINSETLEELLLKGDSSPAPENKRKGMLTPKENFEKYIKCQLLVWFVATDCYAIVDNERLKRPQDINMEKLTNKYFERHNDVFSANQCTAVMKDNIKSMMYKIVSFDGKNEKEKKQLGITLNFRLKEGKLHVLIKKMQNLENEWFKLYNDGEKPRFFADMNIPQLSHNVMRSFDTLEATYETRRYKAFNQPLLFSKIFTFIYSHGQSMSKYDWAGRKGEELNKERIFREKTRCTRCNYIIGDLDYVSCADCEISYHIQCLQKKLNTTSIPSCRTDVKHEWRCDDCDVCKVCFSKNRNEMITCAECKSLYHLNCESLEARDSREVWFCESCSKCSYCEEIVHLDRDIIKMVENKPLCEKCVEIYEKKEYCRVCQKPWSQKKKSSKGKIDSEWILCNNCSMWIHRQCDPLIDDHLFNQFSKTNKIYLCPFCRKEEKNKNLVDFIEMLALLDANKFFFTPVDIENIPYYKKVIQTPMDFETMIAKAKRGEYIEDPYRLLKLDFELICNNAMTYNFPKSPIHIEAKKMRIFGLRAFEYFKDWLSLAEDTFVSPEIPTQGPHLDKENFLSYIDTYYFDILFSNEREGNNKNVALLRLNKPQGKDPSNGANKKLLVPPATGGGAGFSLSSMASRLSDKDIVIEISGLNKALRSTDRRGKLQVKKRHLSDNLSSMAIEGGRETRELSVAEKNFEGRFENYNKISPSDSLSMLTYKDNTMTKSLSQSIQEMLNKKPKGKPYFYFEQIVIHFTDQSLNDADLCFVCGSFSNDEHLLFCSLCQEAYHPFCISKNYDENKFQRLKQMEIWMCPNCRTCEICKKHAEDGGNLICAGCENLYHLKCKYQFSKTLPAGSSWKCESCFECKSCGSKKIFQDNQLPPVINWEFCQDFNFCYQCGILNSYYAICRICRKKVKRAAYEKDIYGLSYLSGIEHYLECQMCKHMFHSSCFSESAENIMTFHPTSKYTELMLGQNRYFSTTSSSQSTGKFLCTECFYDTRDLKQEEQTFDYYQTELYKIKTLKGYMKLNLKLCTAFLKERDPTLGIDSQFINRLSAFFLQNRDFFVSQEWIQVFDIIRDTNKLKAKEFSSSSSYSLPQSKSTSQQVLLNTQPPPHKPLPLITSIHRASHRPFSEAGLHVEKKPNMTLTYEKMQEKVRNSPVWNISEFALMEDTYADLENIDFIIPNVFRSRHVNTYFIEPGLKYTLETGQTIIKYLFLSGAYDLLEYLNNFEVKLLGLDTQTVCNNDQMEIEENWDFQIFLNLLFPNTYKINDCSSNKFLYFPVFPENLNRKLQVNLDLKDIKEKLKEKELKFEVGILTRGLDALDYFVKNLKMEEPIISRDSSTWGDMVYEAETTVRVRSQIVRTGTNNSKSRRKNPEIEKDPRKEGLDASSFKPFDRKKSEAEMINIDPYASAQNFIDRMKVKINELYGEFCKKPINTLPKIVNKLKNSNVFNNNKKSKENSLHNVYGKIFEDNELVNSPLSKVKCVMCKLNGERKLSGRLLNFDLDAWVHCNCALWSNEVYENIEGGLSNFYLSFKRADSTSCEFCKQDGASLSCCAKNCKNKYHFICAFQDKCLFLKTKLILCFNCYNKQDFPLSEENLVTEFSTERRLYIMQSPASENAQEKQIEFMSHTYNRLGSLTVLSIKKEGDLTSKKNVDEYFIVRRVNRVERGMEIEGKAPSIQASSKKRILLGTFLTFNKKHYMVSVKNIDDTQLLEMIRTNTEDMSLDLDALGYGLENERDDEANFFSEKRENLYEIFENSEKIDDIGSLWKLLSDRLLGSQLIDSIQLYFRITIDGFDFLGDFLGFHKSCIRNWIKNAQELNKSTFKRKECPSFPQLFFSKNLDEMNPFERSECIEQKYLRLRSNNRFINRLNFEQKKVLRNPKMIGFAEKRQKIKDLESRKKGTKFSTEELEVKIKPEELLNDMELDYNLEESSRQKDLEKAIRMEYSKYKSRSGTRVYVAPSKIHKYGLFARANFKKWDIVVEYMGEYIRNSVADLREKNYEERGPGGCYMFRIDKDYVIDATYHGNEARYLNHSCDPNCASAIIDIDGSKKIIVYAKRDIQPEEEITYDYQFDIEADKLKCTCGSKKCLGSLN